MLIHSRSQDHPCGAQSPFKGNTTLPTTMASTAAPSGSATNAIPVTGFGGAAPTGTSDSSPSKGNTGTIFMPNAGLGLAALFSSVFFGFAVLL